MPTNLKRYAEIERLVRKMTPTWEKRLRLDLVVVEHAFLDSYFGDDGEEDFKISAVTEVRWNYDQAKVKWYLPSIARHDDAELERILVHELCHVVLAPEQGIVDTVRGWDVVEEKTIDVLTELREAATERMTRILLIAYAEQLLAA